MPLRQHTISARVTTSGPDPAGVRRVHVDGAELATVAAAHDPTDDGPTFTVALARCPGAPLRHHASLAAAMCAALDVAQLYV